MEQKNRDNFAQFNKSENAKGNKPGHWINNIVSQDGSEAASYENFMETKANHIKEIEKRRSSQVSEGQTAEPTTPISPKESQAMEQKIKEKAEQEIIKAFNEMGFNCKAIRK